MSSQPSSSTIPTIRVEFIEPYPRPYQISHESYPALIHDALLRKPNNRSIDVKPQPSQCKCRQDVYIETAIQRAADAGGDAILRTYFCEACMEHVGTLLLKEGENEKAVGGTGMHRFEKYRGDHWGPGAYY